MRTMRVISRRPLREFGGKFLASTGSLNLWYRTTLRAVWRNFQQLKSTFGSADVAAVKSGQTVVIFDIGGNKYRMITRVSYEKGKIYVLRVMTDREYDRGSWKEQL